MPCNCDYMEPRHEERESKQTATLLCFVRDKLGMDVDPAASAASGNIYGNPNMLNYFVTELCRLCTAMTGDEQERIIYNARSATSRELAGWWERHEAADRAREAKEAAEYEEALAKKTMKLVRKFPLDCMVEDKDGIKGKVAGYGSLADFILVVWGSDSSCRYKPEELTRVR